MSKTAIAIAVAAGVGATGWFILRSHPAGQKGSGLSEEFSYDVAAYRNVDPAMVRYRQAAEIDTGFQEARGVAAGADGRIYAAGDRAIRVFDAGGRKLSEIALGAEPRALAVDADGTIYVAMRDHLEVYDAQGRPKAAWESPGAEAILTSVAVSAGEVFLADAGDRAILRYDKAGKILGRLARKDDARGIPGIVVRSPHLDVAMGADGLLRVANSGRLSVETYLPDGGLEIAWGAPSMDKIEGFCGCCNPTDIAVLADGRVVTAEKGIPRVKLYDAHGQLLAVVAPPAVFEQDVVGLDLAADPAGRILVLDPAARKIRVFVEKEGA